MLKCKSLLDYTNLFSPNEYEKNDNDNTEIFSITKNFFYDRMLKKVIMKKSITLSAISIENLKTLNYHIFLYKTYNI